MSANTRLAGRSAASQYVLNLLNFGQDIKDYLEEQADVNVRQLVNVSDNDIAGLKDESGGILKLG